MLARVDVDDAVVTWSDFQRPYSLAYLAEQPGELLPEGLALESLGPFRFERRAYEAALRNPERIPWPYPSSDEELPTPPARRHGRRMPPALDGGTAERRCSASVQRVQGLSAGWEASMASASKLLPSAVATATRRVSSPSLAAAGRRRRMRLAHVGRGGGCRRRRCSPQNALCGPMMCPRRRGLWRGPEHRFRAPVRSSFGQVDRSKYQWYLDCLCRHADTARSHSRPE